jgi:hypothetical protein
VVAESDLAGTLKSEYVFFDGARVARREGAVKNTEKLNGTVRDGTIRETGEHVEVKSGASINDTQQLRSMGQTAVDATGKPLKVVTTNPNVRVSVPAQKNPNLKIEPLKKE